MKAVPDPRCGRKTKHNHAEILVCLICGFLAGKTTIRRSMKWCKRHLGELREHLELKNGIASPSTVSRVLSGIDEELFALEFMEGHFVMMVKKNQPEAYGEIVKYFREMSEDRKRMKKEKDYIPRHPQMQRKYEEIRQVERSRERQEHRWYSVCTESSLLTRTQKEWGGSKGNTGQ